MSLFDEFCNRLVPGRRVAKPDPRHSFGRTLCRSYILRRQRVKDFWLVAGFIMLLQPVLHFVVVISLFTTFLSFMYLDESEEALENQA